MPGYVVNGTQQSTTMEDYAVRYSMYLNGFNGFMLNLIFHDSSIFSPTKKTLQSSEQHLFKHLPWFPTEISIYSIYIYIRCDVPRSKLRTKHQVPHQHPKGPWIVDSRGPRPGPPRSKIPRGRGPHLAYMRHRKVNDQTSRRNHRLEKKTPTWREFPMGRKNEKNPTPRIQLLLRSFLLR